MDKEKCMSGTWCGMERVFKGATRNIFVHQNLLPLLVAVADEGSEVDMMHKRHQLHLPALHHCIKFWNGNYFIVVSSLMWH